MTKLEAANIARYEAIRTLRRLFAPKEYALKTVQGYFREWLGFIERGETPVRLMSILWGLEKAEISLGGKKPVSTKRFLDDAMLYATLPETEGVARGQLSITPLIW